MNKLNFDFSKRISDILSKHGKNQAWLASVWGITPQSVSSQLSRKSLSAERILQLAMALKIDISDFFPSYVSSSMITDPPAEYETKKPGNSDLEQLVAQQRTLLQVREESNQVLKKIIEELEERVRRLESKSE